MEMSDVYFISLWAVEACLPWEKNKNLICDLFCTKIPIFLTLEHSLEFCVKAEMWGLAHNEPWLEVLLQRPTQYAFISY